MSAKYKDFDAFIAAQNKVKPIVKLYGKEYVLPPELPALVMLKAAEMAGKELDEASNSLQLVMLAETLLGKDNLREVMDNGLTVNELGQFIQWATSFYNGTPDPLVVTETKEGN